MAGPSGGSPGSSVTPESPSGRFSNIPSPTQRLGIASHQNLVRSTRSSTRFFWTTRPRRPNSVTPRRRCSVAFATNMTTTAVTPKCNAMCSSIAKRKQETFIPLGHLPGQRLEADFGHIHVDFPDGRQLVSFLVTTWAYSNYPFVLALPFERTEAILEGMVQAFEFFGCVPKEVWWDNPKTVATLILEGRERQIHPRYAALASHYVFNPLFCTPARGNEKPDAESTVKAVQRRFSTPVPRVADLDELNRHFRQRCQAERERTVQSLSGPFLIGTRFAEEQAAAAPLPDRRFDTCVIRPTASVDKYQTVAFDRNRYSVPRPVAFQLVTVKGYVDRVVIVAGGQVVATHKRSLKPGPPILDPLHYLPTLGHKAGCVGPCSGLPGLEAPGLLHRVPHRAGAELRGELPARGGLCGSCNSCSIILWTVCVRRSRTAFATS